ncbi:MAG: efflux RND transporter periplasmic adaptor subunit [Chloroflexota bacterium]|nr:efflux RND transporter periplasmic adaptor subunit [Chloroflexota bacterium]
MRRGRLALQQALGEEARAALSVLGVSLLAAVLAACRAPEAEEAAITASGFIEGKEVAVAAETQGLIVEVLVGRGDEVEAEDVVVRLEDAALRSQRAEAEAALAAARADLHRVQAGSRAEEIKAARASLDEAQARREGAEQAVIHAQEAITYPLQLDSQINEARARIALAEQNVELHEAELEATKVKRGVYSERGGDIAAAWDLQLRAAEANLAQAEAQLEGARAYFSALMAMRDNPLTLEAALNRAQTEYELAEVEVARAEARVEELEAGATGEEVALAEARVREAEAGVALVDARLEQLTLAAPMSGVVSTRSAQAGETATAGKPLLTIANLDEMTLVIYVPQTRIGEVRIGQKVKVTVDSFPERTFVGQVDSIAGEAEYTPQYVQTEEERAKLVFAVDVGIPNPDHALKPGMPADARIVP